MSNLQSINPRSKLTQEFIDEIESAFLMVSTARTEADGRVVQEMEAVHLPKLIAGLGLGHTETVKTVSKSAGLFIPLETVLQISCQAIDRTDNFGLAEMRELYALFDADGDGLVESYEIQRVLNLVGENIEHEDMSSQMQKYDTTYEGENISFSDWRALLLSDPVSARQQR